MKISPKPSLDMAMEEIVVRLYRVIWDSIRVLLGLYRDNRKENANYRDRIG